MADRPGDKPSTIRMLFVIVCCATALAYGQRDYAWGVVSSFKTPDGVRLTVHVDAALLQRNPSSDVLSTNKSLWSSEPLRGDGPQRIVYVAVPPDVDVAADVSHSHLIDLDPQRVYVQSRFKRMDDSTSIVSVEEPLSKAGLDLRSPIVQILGYDWFRGARLLKLGLSPLRGPISSLKLIQDFDVTLKYHGQTGSAFPYRSVSAEGLRDDDLLSSLVANPQDVPQLQRTQLSWNDTTGGWIPIGSPAIKLAVSVDGIYRLRFADLQQRYPGIGSVDPTTFRLFNHGKEVPLFVAGEADHIFGSTDYIEFFGHRNYGLKNYKVLPNDWDEQPEYYNRYTDTSYYWLTWGIAPGLRMSTNDGSAASADTLHHYTQLVHLEQNQVLQFCGNNVVLQQDPRWTAGDLWAWGWLIVNGLTPSTFAPSFVASDIYAQDTISTARAKLGSWGATSIFPAHQVRLRVNNSDTLARADFQQYQIQILAGTFSTGSLANGSNTVLIHSLPTASYVNQMLVDWVDVEYPRWLRAIDDSLMASFPNLPTTSPRVVQITNVTTADPLIYKVGIRPKRITAFDTTAAAPFVVTFRDTVGPGDQFIVMGKSKIRAPDIVAVKTFADLRNQSRRADYILITTRQFIPSAQSYAAMIGSTYQVVPAVIDVSDIFDEFGYGYPRPEAIREFLKAASRWQSPMPSYVCLVGDASWDFKNSVYVPNPAIRPVNSVPALGYPVSDPWLAVLDDSSIVPQYCIGRIVANTPAEFQRYQQKVQSYLGQKNDDWNKRYMFFAGGDVTVPGQVASFKAVADYIINSIITPSPVGGVATNFYKTTTPQSDFGPYTLAQVQEAIGKGALVINYIGHSGTMTWDNGIGDPQQLQNTRNKFPLISDFGCSTARFAEPDIRSFGELFTVGDEGSAIAYVGNSSLGFTSVATGLPIEFYKSILQDSVLHIGKAHLIAKIARMNASGGPGAYFPPSVNRIMMLTNTLLGDPILELAVPKKPNLSVANLIPMTIPAMPDDDNDSLKLLIPYMNTGRFPIDSFDVSVREMFAGTTSDTLIRRSLPAFQDTLAVQYPIKGKPGVYDFLIQLNPNGKIAELDNSDNTVTFQSVVLSSDVRPVRPSPAFEYPPGPLVFLNPVKHVAGSATLDCSLDTNQSFSSAQRILQPLGQTVTKIRSFAMQAGKTYYWRAGIQNSSRPPSTGSFVVSSDTSIRWKPEDTLDWGQAQYVNTKFTATKGVQITDQVFALRIVSAGFNDGGFAAVEVNGLSVLPSSFDRGINVAVFDSASMAVKATQAFDTYAGSTASDQLVTFLNQLATSDIVAFALRDEGTMNLTSNARTAIRQFGSVYADSLVYPRAYRASWAFLGKRGATMGSLPERFSYSGTGRVVVDTTITRKVMQGSVVSPEIGPAGWWGEASATVSVPSGTNLSLTVIGVKHDGGSDTLLSNQAVYPISLSMISPRVYPRLKLKADLVNVSGVASPILSDWSVTARPSPELAVNYQSVAAIPDSVLEGYPVSVTANVFNVGGTAAESVYVALVALDQTSLHGIDTIMIPAIQPDSSARASFAYPTTGRRGDHVLYVEVDPKQRIAELYQSNNVYSIPIHVFGDTSRPTYAITFDGQQIVSGDYVSPSPEIRIEIRDNGPLPITSPAAVGLALDGRNVSLSATTPDSLFQPTTGATKAVVVFRPVLTSGEHQLSLQVQDASGNTADTAALQILFRVEPDAHLHNVLNFPNPFANETNFTFDLSGMQLPDEVTIKIYTVAGRKINEIRLPRSEIHLGFNSVFWNGRDNDGDEISNGIYFYKVAFSTNGKTEEVVQKLAKVR